MSSGLSGQTGPTSLTGQEQEREMAALKKLRLVFTTIEQLEQLADLSVLVKDRAVIRVCDQSLNFEVNDKGYVRYFHLSDNVPAVKPPKSYKSE